MISHFRGRYFFLSNFYFVFIEFEGDLYPSIEYAYQSTKTLNITERTAIRNAGNPSIARCLGRRVSLRRGWSELKLIYMREFLRQKFAPGELRDKLLTTGTETIVEGNTWGDTFWGVCNGKGENHLGKLLMEIRDTVRLEDSSL